MYRKSMYYQKNKSNLYPWQTENEFWIVSGCAATLGKPRNDSNRHKTSSLLICTEVSKRITTGKGEVIKCCLYGGNGKKNNVALRRMHMFLNMCALSKDDNVSSTWLQVLDFVCIILLQVLLKFWPLLTFKADEVVPLGSSLLLHVCSFWCIK